MLSANEVLRESLVLSTQQLVPHWLPSLVVERDYPLSCGIGDQLPNGSVQRGDVCGYGNVLGDRAVVALRRRVADGPSTKVWLVVPAAEPAPVVRNHAELRAHAVDPTEIRALASPRPGTLKAGDLRVDDVH